MRVCLPSDLRRVCVCLLLACFPHALSFSFSMEETPDNRRLKLHFETVAIKKSPASRKGVRVCQRRQQGQALYSTGLGYVAVALSSCRAGKGRLEIKFRLCRRRRISTSGKDNQPTIYNLHHPVSPDHRDPYDDTSVLSFDFCIIVLLGVVAFSAIERIDSTLCVYFHLSFVDIATSNASDGNLLTLPPRIVFFHYDFMTILRP